MAADIADRADVSQAADDEDFSGNPIAQAIRSGIVFKGKGQVSPTSRNKKNVKTKAKKKGYVTGSHGSASAQKKADIRQRRANRHKS